MSMRPVYHEGKNNFFKDPDLKGSTALATVHSTGSPAAPWDHGGGWLGSVSLLSSARLGIEMQSLRATGASSSNCYQGLGHRLCGDSNFRTCYTKSNHERSRGSESSVRFWFYVQHE